MKAFIRLWRAILLREADGTNETRIMVDESRALIAENSRMLAVLRNYQESFIIVTFFLSAFGAIGYIWFAVTLVRC